MANKSEKEESKPKELEEKFSFLQLDPKETNKSLFSQIKKETVLFPMNPFHKDEVFVYKIVFDFLSANPNKKAIWFASDRSVKKILSDFKNNGFDISDYKDNIIFIDAISKSVSTPKEEKHFQILYLDNPDNLTELSMLLQDLFEDETIELAVFDSLNGMLTFNDESNILKFVRFLSSIAEETNTTAILIFFRGQYPEQLENAFKIAVDDVLSVEGDAVILRNRSEKIEM